MSDIKRLGKILMDFLTTCVKNDSEARCLTVNEYEDAVRTILSAARHPIDISAAHNAYKQQFNEQNSVRAAITAHIDSIIEDYNIIPPRPQWGHSVRIFGKRPSYILDNDLVLYDINNNVLPAIDVPWYSVFNAKLVYDHPHYLENQIKSVEDKILYLIHKYHYIDPSKLLNILDRKYITVECFQRLIEQEKIYLCPFGYIRLASRINR